MQGQIFISYRRATDAWAVEQLRQELVGAFGEKNVFLDKHTIGALQTDAVLVSRALAGSDAAFSRLIERHQAAVRGFLRRMLGGGWAEADDVAQEAFLAAWGALLLPDGPGPFRLLILVFLALVLIDRRFRRDLPIQADYVGQTVDTLVSERVSVEWKEIEGEDKVVLYTPESNE